MFTAIIDFIFLGWFFWPLFATFSICTYLCVNDDEVFEGGPLVLIALAMGAAAVRWPEFRSLIFSIKGAALTLGIYIAIGGAVALWKWLAILMDFRKAAPALLVKGKLDKERDLRYYLARNIYTGNNRSDKVKELNGSFYPNSNAFPIATWWVYWPFFSLQVVFDPVIRIIKRVANFFADLYEVLAKKFSVS